MLSRRLDRVAAFTRRDAVRLAVAAVLLITGLTAVLSIDDLPRAVDLSVGDLATADVRAPRTLVFESETETAAARQAARDAVPPQYDYKAETAAALTRRQLDALAAVLAPVDAAFAPAVTAGGAPGCPRRTPSRASTLASRKTLDALAPERWVADRRRGDPRPRPRPARPAPGRRAGGRPPQPRRALLGGPHGRRAGPGDGDRRSPPRAERHLQRGAHGRRPRRGRGRRCRP